MIFRCNCTFHLIFSFIYSIIIFNANVSKVKKKKKKENNFNLISEIYPPNSFPPQQIVHTKQFDHPPVYNPRALPPLSKLFRKKAETSPITGAT